MFEGVVSQVLAGYLGRYIKGLQKEQLKIGIWNEEVLLENVELLLEAFDYLRLPFALKNGRVGKLSIRIPWKRLGWDPIIVDLNDVFICASQREDNEWSSESVEKRELAGKMAKLNAVELAKFSKRVSNNQTDSSFISYISAKILDSIQVSIHNLHMMFIDLRSETKFILGLKFSSLTITTDGRKTVSTMSVAGKSRSADVNKIVEISTVCLYYNLCKEIDNVLDIDGTTSNVQLSSSMTPECEIYDFLVHPFDATIYLLANKTLKSDGAPQYSLSAELDTLAISLNEIQLQQIIGLFDYLSICSLREKYGRYRPSSNSLRQKPVGWQKMWWQYAQNSVLADVRVKLRKSSWRNLGRRIDYRRKYVKLYKIKLERIQQGQIVEKDILQDLEMLDKECDIDDILNYRSIAEQQIRDLQAVSNTNMTIAYDKQANSEHSARSWLNWVSLGMLGAGGTADVNSFAGIVSDDIIKDICEATEFCPSSFSGDLSKRGSFCFISANLSINKVIAVIKSNRQEFSEVIFDGFHIKCEFWDDSVSFLTLMNAMKITNSCNGNVIFAAREALPEENLSRNSSPFVDVRVAVQYINQNPNHSIKVVLQPFEASYDSSFFGELVHILHVVRSYQFQQDRVLLSLNKMMDSKFRLEAKAKHLLNSRRKVNWDVILHNAVIHLPLRNKVVEDITMNGSIIFKSSAMMEFDYDIPNFILPEACPRDASDFPSLNRLDLYNYYEIQLNDFQVNLRKSVVGCIPFFDSIDASVTLRCCIFQDEPILKPLQIDLIVPSLHLNVSPQILVTILQMRDVWSEKKVIDADNMLRAYKIEKIERSSFFMLSATLDSLSLKVGLEDDAGDNPVVFFNFGSTNIRCLSEERLECWILCEALNVNGLHLRGDSDSLTVCSSSVVCDSDSNSCFHGRSSAEGCFQLHYHSSQNDSMHHHEFDIFIGESNLHIYPVVFQFMARFCDHMHRLERPSSTECNESFETEMEGVDCFEMAGDVCSEFGISNFCDKSESMGISLDCFPFVGITNPCFRGNIGELMFTAPKFKNFYRKDSHGCRSPNFNVRKCFGVRNSEPKQLQSCFETQKLVININLKGMQTHLHDSSGILGTFTIPLCVSSLSIGRDGGWQFLFSIDGLLFSSSWSPSNIRGFCPISSDITAVLNVRAGKTKSDTGLFTLSEICIGIQNTSCILSPDYLAMIVGYFSLDDWNYDPDGQSDSRESQLSNLQHQKFGVILKFEILDSEIIFPLEKLSRCALHLSLPQLYLCYIPSSNLQNLDNAIPVECRIFSGSIADRIDFVNLYGRRVSLSMLLIEDDVNFSFNFHTCNTNGNHPVISQLDADLWIRLPCRKRKLARKSSLIMMKADVCNLNIGDEYFFVGCREAVDIIDKFSSVRKESELFKSDVLQFLQLKRSIKEGTFACVSILIESLITIKFCIAELCIKLFGCIGSTSIANEMVAKADLQLNLTTILHNDTLRSLEFDIPQLIIISPGTPVLLAVYASDGSVSSCFHAKFSKSSHEKSQLRLVVPCFDIWLYISFWKEIFDLLSSFLRPSENDSCLSPESGNPPSSAQVVLESVKLPCSDTECTVMDEVWLLLLSENITISLHFPVWEKGEVSTNPKTAERCNSSLLDSASVRERIAMSYELDQNCIKVTAESKSCEVIFGKKHLKFKSNIEKLRATLESTQTGEVRSLQFIQISQVRVGTELFETLGLSHTFIEVHIENFDMRLSHQVLKFWSDSQFLLPEATSSQIRSHCLVTNVHLKRSTLLLCDGRLSPHVPILEKLMQNVLVEIKQSNGIMEVSVTADLLVNYNNIDKVAWEPILEPWSCQLRMVKKKAGHIPPNISPLTDIYLTSSGHLKLNITEPLIETIFWASQVLKDALGTSETDRSHENMENSNIQFEDEMHKRRYSPYVLRNDTYLPLRFNVFRYPDNGDYPDQNSYGNGDVVHPGGCVPIYFQETPDEHFFQPEAHNSAERLVDKKMNAFGHHMISIQFEGTFGPSEPMSMDLVGLTYFEVNFANVEVDADAAAPFYSKKASDLYKPTPSSGLIVPVVFEVTMQHLSKMIRVYSTVILVNTTSVPLEIRFDIPFGVSPKILDPILPGQEFPLPLHLAEAGRLRWRPAGINFLWSEAYSLSYILSQGSRPGFLKSFMCYPSPPSGGPFRCCISVQDYGLPLVGERKCRSLDIQALPGRAARVKNQKVQSSFPNKKYFIHQVKLITPFLVKNYLPIGVSLTLDSAGVEHVVFLDEADVASVFAVDSTNDLKITFEVKGFRPITSKFPRAEAFAMMAKYNAPNFFVYETLTFTSDLSSVPICVRVQKGMDSSCGAREVDLSVPFLLYNSTGLPLSILDSNHERKGIVQVVPPSYSLIGAKQIAEKRGFGFFSCNQESSFEILDYKGFVNPFSKILKFSNGQPWYFSDTNCRNSNGRVFDSSQMKSESSTMDVEHSGAEGDKLQNIGRDAGRAFMYAPIGHDSSAEIEVRLRVSLPNFGAGSPESAGWSNPFSLMPTSGSTSVTVPLPWASGAFLISATSISVPEELSGRTKAIAFQPRYIICNACRKDLDFKQKGTSSFVQLGIGQHSHLHWMDTARDLLVSIRFSEPGWQWSGGFLPDRLGDTQLKMINYISSASSMVRVEVKNADLASGNEANTRGSHGDSLTQLILLSDDETGFMPYRIDNFSTERLRIYQQNCVRTETTVHSYTSHRFAWDEPCYPHRLIVEVPGERVLGMYNLDVAKDFAPVCLSSTFEKPERRLHVSIHAEGAIKVLNIVDSLRHFVKEIKDSGFLGLGEKRQVDLKQDRVEDYSETITLHFSFISISLINSTPQELLFACAKETTIVVLQSLNQQNISLHMSSLQIDNQLPDTPFPVILSFDNQHKRRSASLKNKEGFLRIQHDNADLCISDGDSVSIFSLTATKWRATDPSLVSFKYINLRLSPICIELEQQILLSISDFLRAVSSRLQNRTLKRNCKQNFPCDSIEHFSFIEKDAFKQKNLWRVSECAVIQRKFLLLPSVLAIGAPWQQIYLFARRQKKVYVEMLELATVKLSVSFASIPWMNCIEIHPEVESLSRISSTTFQRGLMALIDIEGVPVHLSQLVVEHLIASRQSFQEILVRHYTRQLLHEIYKILGSAGVIGNPLGFARNVRMGIEDSLSFYSRGILKSPTEIFRGIFRGSTSLLSNTVYTISSATTQFTRLAHKGIVAFAFDMPAAGDLEVGLKNPGSRNKGVLNEFLEGLTGLLQSPIRGAERNGLLGVISGIAMGTAGLFARPMASILETTGQTAQSIRNRSGRHLPSRLRLRLPRPLNRGVPLSPYSWEEAIGISVLLQAEGSRLKDERLIFCRGLRQEGRFAVVTEGLLLDAYCLALAGFRSPGFAGVPAIPVWAIQNEMSLESVIHASQTEEILNVVGSNMPSTSRQRRGGGGGRNGPWSPLAMAPLYQMSLELTTQEDAEDFLRVLLSTAEQWKELRRAKVRILHRSDLE